MIRTTKAWLIGSISELLYQLVSIKRKVLEVGKGDLPPCSTSFLYRLSSVKPWFLSSLCPSLFSLSLPAFLLYPIHFLYWDTSSWSLIKSIPSWLQQATVWKYGIARTQGICPEACVRELLVCIGRSRLEWHQMRACVDHWMWDEWNSVSSALGTLKPYIVVYIRITEFRLWVLHVSYNRLDFPGALVTNII